MVQLGSEFEVDSNNPPPSPVQIELRGPAYDPGVQLLSELRSLMTAMPDLIRAPRQASMRPINVAAPEVPTPVVHVEAPDLSDIVMAVTGLKPGADVEDIGAAIAKHLNPPSASDANITREVLEELVKKIDFRMQGVGRAFGSSGPSNISDNPNRQLGVVSVTAGTLALGPVSTATVAIPDTNQNTWTSGGAVQLVVASNPVTNGVLVRGLKANTNPVYVGASGVTTSTGFELSPGETTSFTCKDANLLYFIGTHAGDGVCYSVL